MQVRRRIAFAVTSLAFAGALAAVRAPAQEKPGRKGKDGPPAAPADVVKMVESKVLGASLKTLLFTDAAATEDGRRTQFDPIPEGTAFEVWLEGLSPRKVYVDEPDPDRPGETRQAQKPFVSVLRVVDQEWDDYVAFLLKDTPPGDDATFLTVLATVLLQQKAVVLAYRDELPAIEKRAAPAIEKLQRGAPFTQVARVHSEDETSRMADGLIVDDTRGSLIPQYPFSKVIFELQPGECTGLIFNKSAAYVIWLERVARDNNPRFDRARAHGIVFKYTTGAKTPAKDLGRIHDSVRVRTDAERFKRLLPPGLQVPPPTAFGPEDIAPIGQPDAPLKNAVTGGP